MNLEALVEIEDDVGGNHIDIAEGSLEWIVQEVCTGTTGFCEGLEDPFALVHNISELARPSCPVLGCRLIAQLHHVVDDVAHEQFGLSNLDGCTRQSDLSGGTIGLLLSRCAVQMPLFHVFLK